MSNLFLIMATIHQGLLNITSDILFLFTVIFGVYVINSKNPIVSVFFLIGLFLSVSLNLIYMGFNFIGLSYLLVYVGAVSILFLFILMLINVRISELLNDTNNGIPIAIFTCFVFGSAIRKILIDLDSSKDKFKNIDLSYLLKFDKNLNSINKKNSIYPKNLEAGTLNYENNYVFLENSETSDTPKDLSKNLSEIKTSQDLNQSFNDDFYYSVSSNWDKNIVEYSDISSIGNIFYSTYSIWLIICSIILLLAMIGAINITKKEKN